MTDFDFVTSVFLIPGAVGALYVQHIAMKSDAAMELRSALRKATKPIWTINIVTKPVVAAPWWQFWKA